jgi:hypothetical protein
MWIALATLGGLILLAIALMGYAPVYPLQSRKNREYLIANGAGGPITVTGTTAAGTGLTALGDMTGVAVGAKVTGTDIPNTPVTRLVAIDNAAHTATLSQAGTGISTGPLVFNNPGVNELNGQSFRLYKAAYTPTVGTVLADLTEIEADFTGYVAKTLTMTQGYVDPLSTPISQSQLLSFVATDAVTPNDIYGWFVDDGTIVLAAGKFNVTVPMAVAGAELSGVLADGYPPGVGWQPLIPSNA